MTGKGKRKRKGKGKTNDARWLYTLDMTLDMTTILNVSYVY